MKDKKEFKYEDILYKKPPILKNHPPMSQYDRAAQFAPFSALTGHKEAIMDVARSTDERFILDETEKADMDFQLQRIVCSTDDDMVCRITYFEEDKKKSGGSYHTIKSKIKKIDEYNHCILMESGEKISFDDIYHIEI